MGSLSEDTPEDSAYCRRGYQVFENLFTEWELDGLEAVLRSFHENWKRDNPDFYQRQAVNSAYITGSRHLVEEQRQRLFHFIGLNKISRILSELIPVKPAFLNTQLFFDPVNKSQSNYWHRDIQYNGYSLAAQREALGRINVIHFRVPLAAERGVEVVPGTHLRWDTETEFEVRTEANGRHCTEALPGGCALPLNRGDLLVFSANMIHRGLYGRDRFAFDTIFCDSDPELLKFADADCLPSAESLDKIENSTSFTNTIEIL